MPYALVHYHELALKGRNRGFFEQRLIQHLGNSLKKTNVTEIKPLSGRIRITFTDESSWEDVRDRIRHTFGVANYSLAHSLPIDYEAPDITPLCKAIETALRSITFETFRVTTKRADKRLTKTSVELNREIGAHVCAATGKRVRLNGADVNVVVEIVDHTAYFSLVKYPGPGGLPTGISRNVMCLISGGIDSPVAAYRMMKRGCKVVFVHFHGRPYLSRTSEEKVRDLVSLLTRYQLAARLYLVPFGDIQRQIVLGSPAPIRVVLYRRMMMRIAEQLAEKEHCWGLVTGDSLGQVASQTAENLQIVSQVAHLPILRPLIGMDKIEITNEAERIGTFETSIEPDEDCCTLFVPPHPNTRCRPDIIQQAETLLPIDEMVREGMETAELAECSFHES